MTRRKKVPLRKWDNREIKFILDGFNFFFFFCKVRERVLGRKILGTEMDLEVLIKSKNLKEVL